MHLPSELKFPSPRAFVDNDVIERTSPLTVAALRSLDRFAREKRFTKLHRLLSYFENTQYDDRPFCWDGSYGSSNDVVGAPVFPGWIPPLNERRPPAIYGIAPMITGRLTSLLFGAGRFPTVRVEDDPVTEDWCVGLKEAANLVDVMKRLRDMGGAGSEAFVSWSFVDAEPVAQVHDPRWVQVLKWRSLPKRIPAHVLVFAPSEDVKVSRDGFLVQKQGWLVREWMEPGIVGNEQTIERVWRYVDEERAPDGIVSQPAQWALEEEKALPAAYQRVPMVGVLNAERLTETWGRGDYEGSEGMIDELNMIMCATFNGVALNADPTLCIDGAPMGGSNAPVKKGGFNTIFGRASYLEISGSSVGAGLSSTDKSRAYTLEATHVANMDPDKIGGAQSGEALRRLMMPSTEHADTLRTRYGAALVEVVRGFLQLARALDPAADGTVRLPPKVEKNVVDGQEKLSKLTPRINPGAGDHITLTWPDYFPDSALDQQAKLGAVVTASGGNAVVSPRRAVEMIKGITGVVDVDQEVKDIMANTRELAEAQAGPLGMMPPDEDQEPPSTKRGEK